MTTTTSPAKVSAKKLNRIADIYSDLRSDYHACVGKKEIESWIFLAECTIDRQVKILDRGVSKQNKRHFERVSEEYDRLQKQIHAAHAKLISMAGR